ncbi:MAG TPA: hypothetical protein VL485_03835 [Ktedonobacteraceae bacterium]|nr:hypothetical protein [Ktedonobacteraceae bacterium]
MIDAVHACFLPLSDHALALSKTLLNQGLFWSRAAWHFCKYSMTGGVALQFFRQKRFAETTWTPLPLSVVFLAWFTETCAPEVPMSRRSANE